MYYISHAACTHVSRKQMHIGTVHSALGRIARGPNVSCPRAVSARAPCRCPPRRRPPKLGRRRTSRPSCARSEPERGSRECDLSPRKRQASECTESGVPSIDPKATGSGVRGTCAPQRARAPRVHHGRGSGRRTELGSACVAMVVARGTCALRRRTSRSVMRAL